MHVDPNKETTSPRPARRGAAMVEFAFFFIIFLLLSVGLMELGRAAWTFTTLAHAARAGGRYAVVHGGTNPILAGDETIEEFVKKNAVGLKQSDITVTVTYDTGTPGDAATNSRGNVVEIQVAFPFQMASGLLGTSSTISMGSKSRMTVLN